VLRRWPDPILAAWPDASREPSEGRDRRIWHLPKKERSAVALPRVPIQGGDSDRKVTSIACKSDYVQTVLITSSVFRRIFRGLREIFPFVSCQADGAGNLPPGSNPGQGGDEGCASAVARRKAALAGVFLVLVAALACLGSRSMAP